MSLTARIRLALPGLASSLLICLVSAQSAHAAPTEPLGHAGRWITDADGRVVVLHGFNVVPVDEATTPADMGMGPDNARWLASHGFNTVRLGLFYARVEPRPGQLDPAYLGDYLRVQKDLSDEGIFTLLDFHQDQLNPRYGTSGTLPSRGVPDWFLRDGGALNTATPYPLGYLSNPALNRAYDSIWQNLAAPDGRRLQRHYADGWQLVAETFRDRPGLLGYDMFNEPWPGSVFATCFLGCPPGGFDQALLTPFTRRIANALRASDARHLIFYEPNLLFDYGSPTHVGDPRDPNAGFTFHDYCIGALVPTGSQTSDVCGLGEGLPLANAERQSERTGDALLLSELGFDEAAARRMTRAADDQMLSWQWWDYYGDFARFSDRKLDALVRPYPQVVAGTPRSFGFDQASNTFTLRFSTLRAIGRGAVAGPQRFPPGSLTEIFVPSRHYPAGYSVAAIGARVISAPGARRLVVATCDGARVVRVVVTRAAGGTSGCG